MSEEPIAKLLFKLIADKQCCDCRTCQDSVKELQSIERALEKAMKKINISIVPSYACKDGHVVPLQTVLRILKGD